MKELLWLEMRKRPWVRRLYEIPVLAPCLRAISLFLVPSHSEQPLRVRRGPGAGLLLDLNPRWEVDYWAGDFEPEIQTQFCALVKPGTVLYDVGGGIGFFSLLAARAGARVFVFEPDKNNASVIERHAAMNRLEKQITVVRKAVFSSTGDVSLTPATSDRGHGNASVIRVTGEAPAQVTVPSTTLDDFARDHLAPSVVKIDVEGAEVDVLSGAATVCQTMRPDMLIEVHFEYLALPIQNFLHERGYDCEWLDREPRYPRHLFARPAS